MLWRRLYLLLLLGIKPHVLSCTTYSPVIMPTETSWLRSAGNRNQNSNRINTKLTPVETVLLQLVLLLQLVQMAQVVLQQKESPHFSSLLLVTPWEQSVCLLLYLAHLVGPEARQSVSHVFSGLWSPCHPCTVQTKCMDQWDRFFSRYFGFHVSTIPPIFCTHILFIY